MKNNRIADLSYELLVGETFQLSEDEFSHALRLKYMPGLGAYRLEVANQIIDFPKSFSIIRELKIQSYISLRDFDAALNDVLKDLMQTSKDVIFYSYKDTIYVEAQGLEDIKKAA